MKLKKTNRKTGKQNQHESLLQNTKDYLDFDDHAKLSEINESFSVEDLLVSEINFLRNFLKQRKLPFEDEYLYSFSQSKLILVSEWKTTSEARRKVLGENGLLNHYGLIRKHHDHIAGARDAAQALLEIQEFKALQSTQNHSGAYMHLLRMSHYSKRVLLADFEPKYHAGMNRSRTKSEKTSELKKRYEPRWLDYRQQGLSRSHCARKMSIGIQY
jgi:hypothetical protein